jgi:hypothetical protein
MALSRIGARALPRLSTVGARWSLLAVTGVYALSMRMTRGFVRNSTIRPERVSAPSVSPVGGFSAVELFPSPRRESPNRTQLMPWARASASPQRGLRLEKGAGMDTAREYRQRAAVCLQLANESRDAYVRVALTELASDLSSMADTAETCEVDQRRPKVS